MKQIAVIAPHPDDETLGCGGALLKHSSAGDQVHWVIATEMTQKAGYAQADIARRKKEIESISAAYPMTSIHQLGYPAKDLDRVPLSDLIDKIGKAFFEIRPEILYLPFGGDAHTDHRVVFEAAAACAKWFRFPSIKRILMCEILSETDFGVSSSNCSVFSPNVYIDITPFLDRKLEIMKLYAGETDSPPFPRSLKNMRSLAELRGSQCGYSAAEAFVLLKEIS